MLGYDLIVVAAAHLSENFFDLRTRLQVQLFENRSLVVSEAAQSELLLSEHDLLCFQDQDLSEYGHLDTSRGVFRVDLSVDDANSSGVVGAVGLKHVVDGDFRLLLSQHPLFDTRQLRAIIIVF